MCKLQEDFHPCSLTDIKGHVQKEIEANGPEVAELHRNAAQLFQQWLAEKKLAHAEAEKRRKQEALDNVIPSHGKLLMLEVGETRSMTRLIKSLNMSNISTSRQAFIRSTMCSLRQEKA